MVLPPSGFRFLAPPVVGSAVTFQFRSLAAIAASK
jgi:hypothetical protein